MKYVVLDDFPAWMVYLPSLILLGVFLLASTLLWRRLRRTSEQVVGKPDRRRSILPLWILAGVSGAALWFMTSQMFGHFHAVAFDPLRVELFYLWPQPSVTLDTSQVIDVKLIPDLRTCGHVELLTRREVHASVNFKKCDNANLLLKELPIAGRR